MQHIHRISRVDCLRMYALFVSDASLVSVFATDMKNDIRQFLIKFSDFNLEIG